MNTTIRKIRRVGYPLLLTAVSALSLQGGVKYEFSEVAPGGRGDPSPSVNVWVADGKIKVRGVGDEAGEMIFHAGDAAMLIIDHGDRVYTRLDQATVSRIAERMNEAMAQYEAAMESVPPAQRQMVENMMRQQMGDMLAGADQPDVDHKATGETETVAGYATRVHEAVADGHRTQSLFVADWSDIPGGEAFSAAFEDMSAFFGEMMQALAQGPMASMLLEWSGDNWFDSFAEVGGFPVRVREYGPSGEVRKETVLTAATEFEPTGDTFAPPPDYRRRDLNL